MLEKTVVDDDLVGVMNCNIILQLTFTLQFCV